MIDSPCSRFRPHRRSPPRHAARAARGRQERIGWRHQRGRAARRHSVQRNLAGSTGCRARRCSTWWRAMPRSRRHALPVSDQPGRDPHPRAQPPAPSASRRCVSSMALGAQDGGAPPAAPVRRPAVRIEGIIRAVSGSASSAASSAGPLRAVSGSSFTTSTIEAALRP